MHLQRDPLSEINDLLIQVQALSEPRKGLSNPEAENPFDGIHALAEAAARVRLLAQHPDLQNGPDLKDHSLAEAHQTLDAVSAQLQRLACSETQSAEF